MEIAKRNGIYEDELSADQIRMVVADHPKTEQLVGNFENVQTAARNVQLWFRSEWIRNRFYDAIKRDPVAADFTIHIDSHCNSVKQFCKNIKNQKNHQQINGTIPCLLGQYPIPDSTREMKPHSQSSTDFCL